MLRSLVGSEMCIRDRGIGGLKAVPVTVLTDEAVPTRLPARLYLPASPGPRPAIVFMHGGGGLYRNNDPSDVIDAYFRRWAGMAHERGFAALFIDSYTPRGGKAQASEVTVRPYDLYAGVRFLRSKHSLVAGRIRHGSIHAVGWSHGGSSVLSALSVTDPHFKALPIRTAAIMYPGCGLYGAFGGIAKSRYCNAAPLQILAAALDPLYTGGNCEKRIERAKRAGCAAPLTIAVYPGAQHSFDAADLAAVARGRFTPADLRASVHADAAVWEGIFKADPTARSQLVNLGAAGCSPESRCSVCHGDCDNDADCAPGLMCFFRDGLQAIPGCRPGGPGDRSNYDFCVPKT
eukprot:TRINITY_DN22780_c0_g3_i3.p1 TRINITY_DN22780_c0_g3~~TRINITY_DN22780_c0_g3_i3.p1  ORF type:complete len:347 (+),score=56.28 TRINITY_DN22780_c0_g3_i3:106-1146(+)